MTVLIALLRAIGPATHAKMSMEDLRESCEAADGEGFDLLGLSDRALP